MAACTMCQCVKLLVHVLFWGGGGCVFCPYLCNVKMERVRTWYAHTYNRW